MREVEDGQGHEDLEADHGGGYRDAVQVMINSALVLDEFVQFSIMRLRV